MLVLPCHDERVRGLAYSPDGTALASCGSDWAVRLWDLASGRQRVALRGHRRNILGVVFSIDGRLLGSAANEPSIRTWDAETGACLSVFEPDGDFELIGIWMNLLGRRDPSTVGDTEIRAAAAAGWRLSRLRPRLLTRDEAIRWRTDRLNASLKGEEPDAYTGEVLELRSGSQALSVYVPVALHLSTRRGAFIAGSGFSKASSRDLEVAFTPGGLGLALTAGHNVLLWPSLYGSPAVLEGHEAPVWSLAFAPDGRTVATGAHDGTVRLWGVDDGRERACLDGEVGIIDSVAFSPDGMTLAAGGKRGIVVWDVDAECWG